MVLITDYHSISFIYSSSS